MRREPLPSPRVKIVAPRRGFAAACWRESCKTTDLLDSVFSGSPLAFRASPPFFWDSVARGISSASKRGVWVGLG